MSHKFLEPIKIGNQTVKNRVMFLAMAKNISNFDDSVSAKDIAYVESVAAGGVGLLVPGAMIVDPEWPSVLPLQPGIYDDRFIPGLLYRSLLPLIQAMNIIPGNFCVRCKQNAFFQWTQKG